MLYWIFITEQTSLRPAKDHYTYLITYLISNQQPTNREIYLNQKSSQPL